MALIQEQILPRNFELIRDRVSSILVDEFQNQSEMAGVSVWSERKIPFTQAELPAVNVLFQKADYDSQNVSYKRGLYTYFIDVYVSEPSTDSDSGDMLASVRSQRMAGIIDYILEHPHYLTLGFLPGFIENVIVESIQVSDAQKQDSLHNVITRLELSVKASENTLNIEPLIVEGYDTQVKIELTDYGFKYSLNN